MPNLTPWMLLTFVAIFALCLCGFCGHMRIKRLREEREEERLERRSERQERTGGRQHVHSYPSEIELDELPSPSGTAAAAVVNFNDVHVVPREVEAEAAPGGAARAWPRSLPVGVPVQPASRAAQTLPNYAATSGAAVTATTPTGNVSAAVLAAAEELSDGIASAMMAGVPEQELRDPKQRLASILRHHPRAEEMAAKHLQRMAASRKTLAAKHKKKKVQEDVSLMRARIAQAEAVVDADTETPPQPPTPSGSAQMAVPPQAEPRGQLQQRSACAHAPAPLSAARTQIMAMAAREAKDQSARPSSSASVPAATTVAAPCSSGSGGGSGSSSSLEPACAPHAPAPLSPAHTTSVAMAGHAPAEQASLPLLGKAMCGSITDSSKPAAAPSAVPASTCGEAKTVVKRRKSFERHRTNRQEAAEGIMAVMSTKAVDVPAGPLPASSSHFSEATLAAFAPAFAPAPAPAPAFAPAFAPAPGARCLPTRAAVAVAPPIAPQPTEPSSGGTRRSSEHGAQYNSRLQRARMARCSLENEIDARRQAFLSGAVAEPTAFAYSPAAAREVAPPAPRLISALPSRPAPRLSVPPVGLPPGAGNEDDVASSV